MRTTNGLLATPYGSLAHGRFAVGHAPPLAVRAIAAEDRDRLPEFQENDRLLFARKASGNPLAASTTIRPRQGRDGFGAGSLEPANRAAAPITPEFSFGPFCLRPTQRVLLEAGRLVSIGGRALDLLIALIERAGELVTKEDLILRVWPNASVCEANLKTQIAALRAALGDGRDGARYVVTTPGRGYSFVAPIASSTAPQPPAPPAASLEAPSNPTVRPTRLIGRAGIVHAILRGLQQRRFITIVGPGGIGKTAVAMAVAETMEASCGFRVCFVELSQPADPPRVMANLASALGVATSDDDPTERVVAFLRGSRTLIVLDCCDRVVDEAALVAERILEGSADVHILVTSREALRAEGEAICRLPALETPPDIDGLTAIEALTFPAVQLFVERVVGNIDDFELSDADAPVVADICRRLDALPLAIEMAAGHVHAFGARGVAAVLGNRFQLLMRGRRTALQRHQSLGAALDWSYETLSEAERVVLRRLSVFAGAFTLDAACAIGADTAASTSEVAEIVANLVDKSLLQVDVRPSSCRYRMLETTHAYVHEKLAECGEMHDVARRYAEYGRRCSEPPIADVRILN